MTASGKEPSSEPDDTNELVRSSLRFPVVGIGASAGGLEALTRLFEHMPSQNGMAFVVILHLSPKHASSAAEILQRSTRMPVIQVNESVEIEPDHVYVIPPSKHLLMTDDHLSLSEARRPRGRHIVIDLFFRALAEVHLSRAISIVLSGTGSDGSLGLSRIKELGGVALAQHPDDAEFDGMPKSAIATQLVDFVLPAAEIPQKLIALWSNMQAIQLPEPAPSDDHLAVNPPPSLTAAEAAEHALREVMNLLRIRTGHDFKHYKRATVLRRIERRLQVNGLPDLSAYCEFLKSNPQEAPALLRDLLISVTNFFRDREAFDALEREVIVPLMQERRGEDQLRAWVSGSATGEEAYSVAMLLCEQADTVPEPPNLLVFATDIDEHAIGVGRTGLYPGSIVVDIAPSRLRQFFTKEDDRYRLKKSVREKVLFALHNILRDPPFSRLDLICCRNLLIYLDRQVQEEILRMFHFALRPGGHLFLGSSESADSVGDLFTVVDKKHRIFKSRSVARSTRHIPSMPLGVRELQPVLPPPIAPEMRPVAFAELHQRLLLQYAPPSVLVGADYHVVYISDGASRYLRHASGEPSHNLLTLIRPELKLELRTALFQAVQSSGSVDTRKLKLERDGRTFAIGITVRPVRETAQSPELLLVLFSEAEDTSGETAEAADERQVRLIHQLEGELGRRNEQLQSVIEQSETSSEEMKASNEELQAINEELRSATEELETSKEELQSINEELITVNFELKVKVEETAKINDDLQNLIGSTDIAVVFIDSHMRIMRYTPRALDVFNLIPSDLGRSLLDINQKLDYDSLHSDAENVFRTLLPCEREVRDSNDRTYIARILPYRTTEDRIEGAVLTFIDITSLRGAEAREQAGEARMHLIAECTRDYAIITMDPAGRIDSWNKAAETIFGFSESEAVGESIGIIFTEEDRGRGAHSEEMRIAREKGRSLDERWHTRKDGSHFFCSGVMTLLADSSDGTPRGFAKIARDFTGSKLLDVERDRMLASERAAAAEAKAANQVKDEFLAIMSHELKHPLNLININAELLQRLPGVSQLAVARRATSAIRMAVSSQAQVIDDMLDLSRVNTGNLNLKLTPLAIGTVVQPIFAMFDNDARSRDLILSYIDKSAGAVVNADRLRIEQIAWNLISNAIKFIPAGGRIEVELSKDESHVKLLVTDTGHGIAPQLLDHVFELFQRGEARSQQRQEDGLGIGLALVDQLSRLHGGHASAYSAGEGKGSCFSVFLPIAGISSLKPIPAPMESGSLRGRRILIVDDTQETLEVLGELLTISEAEVTRAQSARAALALLQSSDFDVLLSDLGMPGMDGFQFIAEVRKLARNAGVAAIALSGFGRAKDVEKAKAAGFDAHLSKPVSFDELAPLIVGLFARKSQPV